MNNISILPPNFGKIITVTPANPAAGANFSFAVPVHTVILPISFFCILTTDATVTTRTMMITSFDGASNTFHTPASYNQTAGLAISYSMQAGNNLIPTAAAFGYQLINMSNLNYLRFGDVFQTAVSNLQAGDQLSATRIKYMQWIQE